MEYWFFLQYDFLKYWFVHSGGSHFYDGIYWCLRRHISELNTPIIRWVLISWNDGYFHYMALLKHCSFWLLTGRIFNNFLKVLSYTSIGIMIFAWILKVLVHHTWIWAFHHIKETLIIICLFLLTFQVFRTYGRILCWIYDILRNLWPDFPPEYLLNVMFIMFTK